MQKKILPQYGRKQKQDATRFVAWCCGFLLIVNGPSVSRAIGEQSVVFDQTYSFGRCSTTCSTSSLRPRARWKFTVSNYSWRVSRIGSGSTQIGNTKLAYWIDDTTRSWDDGPIQSYEKFAYAGSTVFPLPFDPSSKLLSERNVGTRSVNGQSVLLRHFVLEIDAGQISRTGEIKHFPQKVDLDLYSSLDRSLCLGGLRSAFISPVVNDCLTNPSSKIGFVVLAVAINESSHRLISLSRTDIVLRPYDRGAFAPPPDYLHD